MTGTAPDRVAVVGAGPGGSVAALVLARGGVAVDLIDPATFPREKACGDLVGMAGVEVLRGLDLDAVVDQGLAIRGEHFLDRHDRTVRRTEGRTMSPLAAIARPRVDFDHDLRDAARRAGATPMEAKFVAISEVRSGKRTVTLTGSDGQVFERDYAFVLGADGARSRVAREAGLHPGLGENHAVSVRRYVSVTGHLSSELSFFEPSMIPDSTAGPAYCWAFPVAAHQLNVGIYACAPAAGRNLASRLKAFEQRLASLVGASDVPSARSAVRGGIVRYDFISDRAVAPRVALIGDAAGLGHGILGEGITYALRSGELAANAILEKGMGGDLERVIGARYRAEFADFMVASRAEAHLGTTLFADVSPTASTTEGPGDAERNRLIQRIVADASERERHLGDQPGLRPPPVTGARDRRAPGSESVRIPAGSVVRFTMVGGGGAGGHWGGGTGRGATRATGTIAARRDDYEVWMVCAGGGDIDASGDVPAMGGPGGSGHVPGGNGGWGSGSAAGGGGGGGGASALYTADRSICVVAPGGGGAGGGGDSARSRRGDGSDTVDGAVGVPGKHGTGRTGGNGGYGSTREGKRGGGGGGGGGGSVGGDGGTGGTGGSPGREGRSGISEAQGVESIGTEVVDSDVTFLDTPGRGGRGGDVGSTGGDSSDDAVDVRLGAPGNPGSIHLEWEPAATGQRSSRAGTATSTPGC